MPDSITPPPELVKQWLTEPEYVSGWNGKCTMISVTDHRLSNICAQAAQWGADQELEACCEWLCEDSMPKNSNRLRNARRPKPPSLKEQALEQLACIQTDLNKFGMGISTNTIRRALEALDD
jgi:hypothetical protein